MRPLASIRSRRAVVGPVVRESQACRARSWAGVLAALAAKNGAARRPKAIKPTKARRSIVRPGPALAVVSVVPRRGSVLSRAGRHGRSLQSVAGSHPAHAGFERRRQDPADVRGGSWQRPPAEPGSRSEWSRRGCSRGSLGRGLPGHARAWSALSEPDAEGWASESPLHPLDET